MTDRTVFRFAPSPNGYLHLGHAWSALCNMRRAAEAGGRLLLRIEDIDVARSRPEFERAIMEDLEWLGFTWERPVRRQSEHFADYAAALDALRDEGLLYPAFMSRGEIKAWVEDREAQGDAWPRDPDGTPHYPGLEKRMKTAEREERADREGSFTWRLDMQAALRRVQPGLAWDERTQAGAFARIPADPSVWGDVVLARSDTPASYHVAVVVDDALQGITDVVRGRDLYRATAVHRLLQELLGLTPPRYEHHRLVLDADGRKLSKSSMSTAIRQLQAAGATPGDIERMAKSGIREAGSTGS